VSDAPIPFLSPSLPSATELAEDWEQIVASGTYSNLGPFERRFAAAMAERLGADTAVAPVASGTAGLLLAIRACMRAERPRVLVPSFNFVAAPLALRWCGFEPVLLDVDPDTWQPSLASAEAALGADAGAIAGVLLVNTLGVGNPAIGDWEALCREHHIPLVIDSAAGFGATYPDGTAVGSRGTCEVFSLHVTKPLGVGEGGAVASRDHDLIARVDSLKNFGFGPDGTALAEGLNAKLDELSAAIGLRQLATLDHRLEARRALLRAYKRRLEPLGVCFQPHDERSAVAFVSARLPEGADRDALLATLAQAQIGARSYYNPPIHRHAAFEHAAVADRLDATEHLCSRVVSLPTSETLGEHQLERIDALVARNLG
jgi:dTDP-4-amino-4,6-dideoxygalactose transaminase